MTGRVIATSPNADSRIIRIRLFKAQGAEILFNALNVFAIVDAQRLAVAVEIIDGHVVFDEAE
jgi:hypothetical protein